MAKNENMHNYLFYLPSVDIVLLLVLIDLAQNITFLGAQRMEGSPEFYPILDTSKNMTLYKEQ